MTFTQYVQAFVSIAVLFGALFILLKFSKVMQAKRFTKEMQVIDRLPIDSNQSLLIVKVRQKEYLLAAGNKQVSVLDDLGESHVA